MIDETGVVVGLKGKTALVRAASSSHCEGCAAAGACHAGTGGDRVVEAENTVGAVEGQEVVMSVPSRALLKASFQVYMIPVIGVLAGAGAAQLSVGLLAGPAAAAAAAGAGGVAGAVLAVAGTRLYRKYHPESAALRPRITKVLAAGKT